MFLLLLSAARLRLRINIQAPSKEQESSLCKVGTVFRSSLCASRACVHTWFQLTFAPVLCKKTFKEKPLELQGGAEVWQHQPSAWIVPCFGISFSSRIFWSYSATHVPLAESIETDTRFSFLSVFWPTKAFSKVCTLQLLALHKPDLPTWRLFGLLHCLNLFPLCASGVK